MRPNPTAALIAAAVVAFGLIAAVVGLDVAHQQADVATVLALGGPTLAGLLAIARVDHVTAGQNTTLDQHTAQLATITAQTNGVLDKRIRDGVTEVLTAAGVIGQQLAATAPAVTVPAVPATSSTPDTTAPADLAQ